MQFQLASIIPVLAFLVTSTVASPYRKPVSEIQPQSVAASYPTALATVTIAAPATAAPTSSPAATSPSTDDSGAATVPAVGTYTTFTHEDFEESDISCATGADAPLVSDLKSALAALPTDKKVYCLPKGTVTQEPGIEVVKGLYVNGSAEKNEDTCFLVESAVNMIIARCGSEHGQTEAGKKVGGLIRLPIEVGEGDVVITVGEIPAALRQLMQSYQEKEDH